LAPVRIAVSTNRAPLCGLARTSKKRHYHPPHSSDLLVSKQYNGNHQPRSGDLFVEQMMTIISKPHSGDLFVIEYDEKYLFGWIE